MVEETPDVQAETPDADETPNVRQMRERMEAQKAEIEQLRAEKRADVFEKAGFPLDSGQGKAIATLLPDSDITVEKVQDIAKKEFGFEPAGTTVTPPSGEGTAPTADVDSRLDAVASSSTPIPAPDAGPDWTAERDKALKDAVAKGRGNEPEVLRAVNAELRRLGWQEVIPKE